jgi:ABC-type nitrate/sulfonate/bicarbonate transport system substrate-binding protein
MSMRLGLIVAVPAVLALQAVALGADPALSATKVSFGQVSPTATIWPGVVATKKGFFAANGVEMDTVSIGVSPGMQAVAAGSLNIMHNTCNAVISFIEMGGRGVHLSLVSMGIHPGVVVAKKGLKSASELKGKVVGTSSIKSGSTILLRRLLKARGLDPSDYDVVAGQGSAQIFSGLQAGALDAVWLVPPQSLTATAAGYPVIGTFREVAPKFPFVCFATNDAWVKSNTAAAQGFAKAWLTAVEWLYDPNNRAEAEKLLAEALKLSPDIAAASYDELLVNNKDTYPRDGKVEPEVLRAMIDIMVEGEELPAKPQGDIRRYLDDTMLPGGK